MRRRLRIGTASQGGANVLFDEARQERIMPRAPGGKRRLALFTGNYNYTRDGASQAVHRLVTYLEQSGDWQVRIYSPTTRTPAFDRDRKIVSIPSAPVPLRPEYRMALGLTRAATENVRRFDPDIVHLATPDRLGVQAQALARRLGAPVVASVHTRFDSYFSYYGLGWLEALAANHLQAFYSGCDHVLAPTQPIAQALAAEGLGSRVRVWSRGVDREQFNPARRDMDWRRAQGLADDDLVVIFFGRVVMEKGLAVFVDAISRARAACPRIRPMVIGDGPARAWLQQRLPDGVFTGQLSGEALGRAVASADILFNPSTTEAFGNVTLEAMAAGLAAVCADAPSHRALLAPADAGVLCDAADPEAYAAVLVELAEHPMHRLRLGRTAREASAAYSWDAALGSVAEVYEEAMAGRAAFWNTQDERRSA